MGLRAIILLLDNSLSEFILNPGLAPESKDLGFQCIQMGLRAIILLLDNSLSEFILNPGLAPESKEGVRSDDLHPKFQMASK